MRGSRFHNVDWIPAWGGNDTEKRVEIGLTHFDFFCHSTFPSVIPAPAFARAGSGGNPGIIKENLDSRFHGNDKRRNGNDRGGKTGMTEKPISWSFVIHRNISKKRQYF